MKHSHSFKNDSPMSYSFSHSDSAVSLRERILEALRKPLPEEKGMSGSSDRFDPWLDVIRGVAGGYTHVSNEYMVELLEAVRDGEQDALLEKHGVGGHLGLLLLAGHGLVEYGGSPYGCWPAPEIQDLWQPLIDKWKTYNLIVWDLEYEGISKPKRPSRFSR